MTASAAPTTLPVSALSVSRHVVDHDLVARIARGHNLLRRSVHGRPDVIAFARDLAEWSGHNRDLLGKRFVDHRMADAYSSAAEPFIVPASDLSVAAQTEMLREQLTYQVDWLEQVRATIPDRDEPVKSHGDPRLADHRTGQRAPAVLAPTASRMAVTVVGAVARATGMLPIVIERTTGEHRSLLRAAEHDLPPDAVAVVVLEASSSAAFIALGFVAGALGPENVIVVCGPHVANDPDLAEFAAVTMEPGDGWRNQLGGLLEQAGFTPSEVVASRS
jgi:hypothetical protein